ncbi:MAG: relaxase MobL [Oscillospiraceae bacterium]|jgi:hypothetical protein
MAESKSPGIIFSMEFFQADKYMVGGYDFLEYMQRPEAFDLQKHTDDEFKDFFDYMKNEEKSDGIFDLTNNHLSGDTIEEYRNLELDSKNQGCPKYVGVISFRNDFLEECGVISPKGLDINKLKSVARSGMSEMIHSSKKLEDDNVYWTAAIHTNTDNVHIHFAILEFEKRQRKKDMLEIEAFDKLKSKVANKLIGSEQIARLTEISRQSLLPDFKLETYNEHSEMVRLAAELPKNQTWQYGRDSFEPYREKVNHCVRSIINSSPKLKRSFDSFIEELDDYEEKLAGIYGTGERQLYKDFKKNKLDDFYSRAGNSLLSTIKQNQLLEKLEAGEKLRRPAEEKSRVNLARHKLFNSGGSPDSYFSSEDEQYGSLSGHEKMRRHTEEKKLPGNGHYYPRTNYSSGSDFSEYLHSKRELAATIAFQASRLTNIYEHHVDRLKRQFEYEQSIQNRR